MTLSNHTCSYYCHAGIHVFKALAHPSAQAEAVQAAAVRFWGYLGTVQAVRPAREADVSALALQVCAGITEQDRLVRTTQHNPACSAAWLVFVQVTAEEVTP